MADLRTKYVGLDLVSPIVVASAGITETVERMRRCQENGAGAVVMKSYFEEVISRKSPTPRFKVLEHNLGRDRTFTLMSYEQASKWDIERYAEEVSAAKAKLYIRVIPSLNCITDEGWVEGAKLLEQAGADALELNTSCPHGSITFRGGAVEETIFWVVRLVREVVSLPIIAKISPMLTSPLGVVGELERIGVDGVTIFNRMTALDVDIDEERPTLHGGYAGHGGPWAIQYPLRWISQIRPQVKIDIAGSGGVADGRDVVKYLLAGATVVQTCTAVVMNGYGVIRELLDGLERYMEGKGYRTIEEFRGKVCDRILGTEEVDRRHRLEAWIDARWTAPCKVACPVDVPVQAYVRLIAERKFGEALEMIRSRNPFQSICGRVCYHPCEAACTRGGLDEPIAIMALKRFVTEWGRTHAPLAQWKPEREPDTGKRVAVIGAGPAGLTAAHDLARMGYRVTVFEAAPVPGGMMTLGIPAYRLPRHLVEEEIDYIRALGVEIRTNAPIGDGSTAAASLEDVRRDFDAVFIATGAHKSARLGVLGEHVEGVQYAADWLRRMNLGEMVSVGRKVAVVGGGNTAIDAARSAIRLGAEEVYMVYRRTREEMPAADGEIEEAEEEGVRMLYLVAPVEVLSEGGHVSGLRCVSHFLGEPDQSGRRRPLQVEGTDFVLSVDSVITAVGQSPDVSFLGENTELRVTDQGIIPVDAKTGATNIEGVFAGGDVTSGPSTVVEAIAAGKRAARAIGLFLSGQPLSTPFSSDGQMEVDTWTVLRRSRDERPTPRVSVPVADKAMRRRTFSEAVLDLTEQQAVAEASRCLACGCGVGCGLCQRVCIYDGVEQIYDKYRINDRCDGCGLCPERCPLGVISMKSPEEHKARSGLRGQKIEVLT